MVYMYSCSALNSFFLIRFKDSGKSKRTEKERNAFWVREFGSCLIINGILSDEICVCFFAPDNNRKYTLHKSCQNANNTKRNRTNKKQYEHTISKQQSALSSNSGSGKKHGNKTKSSTQTPITKKINFFKLKINTNTRDRNIQR